MIHQIEQHLVAVGQRARRLLIGYALAWIVGVAIVLVTILGLADYLLRFDDRGIRLMATLALIGAITWAVVRFLLPALRFRPTSVQLAQRIEQLHPEMHGRLASTIEFLHQSEDDPTAGSAELRRMTISETDAATDGLNWSATLDSRPTKRAVLVASAIASIAMIIAAIFPAYAAVAVLRLASPLGNANWPRNNYLAFREPVDRIAAGQPFKVELIDDSGQLPDSVYIQYRWHTSGEPTVQEQEKMEYSGGAMVAQKESITRPFEYRAFGGDDDTMPWISVELVEPPRVQSVQITVQPPAYTGYAAYESPERIEAIIGSTVAISGKVTKPIASATVKWGDDTTQSATLNADGSEFSFAHQLPLPPGEGRGEGASQTDEHPHPALSQGERVAGPLLVNKSGRYLLELTDREGLTTAGSQGEIRAVADSPPTVSLDRPAAGLFATPAAAVQIRAVVKDNLAIRSVALVYSRTDQSDIGDQRVELFTGPDSPTPLSNGSPVSAIGESQIIDDRWELSKLNLPPGTQLTFHIAADDYQPKTGISTARKITIVTPAELEERISGQQASILAELARILKLERDIHSHTAGIREQIAQVGTLPKASSDLLQTAELNQRQVRRALASRADGVLSQIANLTAELESNRLDSPEITRRLQQMADSIEQLENEPLPFIERELTTAVKESKSLPADSEPSPPGRGQGEGAGNASLDSLHPHPNPLPKGEGVIRIRQSLKSADASEGIVIAALEKLIDELTEWSHYRGLARDIGQIRQEQAALQKQTQQIGAATIALDAQNLSPQQRADLNNASRVQSDLAGRFSKLLTQMDRMVQQPSEDAKTSTDAVADALQIARQQNLAGRMRDGADQVASNRMGQAFDQQSAVLHGLDEMLDAIANRHEQELSRLVKKLRDAEQQLDELRQQQEGLQKKLERLTKESQQPGANQAEIRQQLERLQREQKRLQAETQRLTRQLERLQAEKASKSTAGASDRMGEVGDQAAQNKPAEALDEATKAKQDLDEAQKELAQQRRKAEEDLAHEQLAKIGDALKSLAERQSHLVDEATAYEAQRDKTTGFTRAQSQSVLDLSRLEASLSAESTALAEKVAAAEVFQLALQRAAGEMTQGAEKLAQLDTGKETQRAAGDALRRLQQIVEALKRDPSTTPPKPNDGGGGGGGGSKSPPGDKIALLAEVKLLKMLQEQVNSRTRELDEATHGNPMLTTDQRREYIELAKEQGKLAELILKKSGPLEPLPEENPESLPDVRREEEMK